MDSFKINAGAICVFSALSSFFLLRAVDMSSSDSYQFICNVGIIGAVAGGITNGISITGITAGAAQGLSTLSGLLIGAHLGDVLDRKVPAVLPNGFFAKSCAVVCATAAFMDASSLIGSHDLPSPALTM
ncbi:MAG: hypothetical protein ACHP65_09660 [Legionellales bacterium]